jgi:hypothetical protein
MSIHCCREMTSHIEAAELHLSYDCRFREYGIYYRPECGGASIQKLFYCPWCGSQLPDSLRDAWFEELDRLGLEPEDDLPIPLRSDAWWRTPTQCPSPAKSNPSPIMHKFPVPRLAEAAVLEWAEELAARLGCDAEDIRRNPDGVSFPHQAVRVELMDQSVVEFKNALFVVSDPKRAIAVFTEHCGHHVLPYHDAKILVDGELKYRQS